MCLKDQEIVELFFERSEQAITELILKYGAAVRNVASNILRNPQNAEEYKRDFNEKLNLFLLQNEMVKLIN